ncbi:branched-chain amino acid ABC transporter permease [Rhizobium sp. L1K21]|uniref:branched-chain amino acid ABC transporter permease n=1 Tax=Rhizobium sp. L1K21 TaxID=2954933 RepID=UPI00209344F0|nr:branched-chain amino acid ABC transporter permease [Rhizobium sp. L1K21]MCO6186033.1 branched-chain amino acid ABC transporter permease [Rhizobium sp. L1K21]
MSSTLRNTLLFLVMGLLLLADAYFHSWNSALYILNLCLISAIMALGVNIQWGYAGLINFGVMGFIALGGTAAVFISSDPVYAAWAAGGAGILVSGVFLVATIVAAVYVRKLVDKENKGLRIFATAAVVVVGYFVTRYFYDPAVLAIEAVDSSATGFLGGLGLPILFSWIGGALFAAGAAWLIGKVALGLREDYLAIATLGISEILVTIMRNEDWLTRGVKNVVGLPRPVPYEVDLRDAAWFINLSERFSVSPSDFASIFVKLCYSGLFVVVLLLVLLLAELALKSPWGRTMRAVRDNETAAEAMGKDVKRIHLKVFILGSAVIGLAGAMLTTMDGQFTPGAYQPLRFTFLIWVMVIAGGSGNNWGAVLGGFLILFFWMEAEPIGVALLDQLTSGLSDDSPIRQHLTDNAQQMRLVMMGLLLLIVMRFRPSGLIPEKGAERR